MTLVNFGDNSLLGSEPNGINNFGVDEPDYTGGPLHLNHNPRNGQPYFNTSQFSENALGTPGTAKRRFFYGPGMNNFDMALLKNLRLTRIEVSAVPDRSIQRLQSRAIFRPASRRRKYRQLHLRPGHQRRPPRAGPAGRKIPLLVLGSPWERQRLSIPRL